MSEGSVSRTLFSKSFDAFAGSMGVLTDPRDLIVSYLFNENK
jgi:hypothetical protein